MKKIDYFKTNLAVFFTLNELYEISNALATESFSEDDHGNHYNSELAWKLREKVHEFIDSYNNASPIL